MGLIPACATALRHWATGYRADAEADEHLKLLACRQREGYETSIGWARKAVRDTVQFVHYASIALALERPTRDIEHFLALQLYDREGSRARFVLTFEAGKFPWVRLLLDELRQVDLTDLFDGVGFSHLTIERRDGSSLTSREAAGLEKAVRRDFGYDARSPEEEIILGFDRDDGRLHVMPHEASEDP